MKKKTGQKVVCIACIPGNPQLGNFIRAILAKYKIWSTYEGSVVYGIMVHDSDALRASELLRADSRFAGKKIEVYPKPLHAGYLQPPETRSPRKRRKGI